MKDFPYYRKKLNRQIIRSEYRTERDENTYRGEVIKASIQEQAVNQKKKAIHDTGVKKNSHLRRLFRYTACDFGGCRFSYYEDHSNL